MLMRPVIEFDDGSGSVLRIQPLRTPRDEAIYECHASNSAGEITASTRLSVLRDTAPLAECLSVRQEDPVLRSAGLITEDKNRAN
ncbi:hypothetical protein F7725_005533 [Dissostichus mawsoni]|uniref:Uncharacterized protein n=1 Tax=Dissostichus mawsoni TaxID=36200 RepID=A0A7J5YVN3_DISMA|nr:hypothetical protein F7725_005533 [Dissostichus mawsoni]